MTSELENHHLYGSRSRVEEQILVRVHLSYRAGKYPPGALRVLGKGLNRIG